MDKALSFKPEGPRFESQWSQEIIKWWTEAFGDQETTEEKWKLQLKLCQNNE